MQEMCDSRPLLDPSRAAEVLRPSAGATASVHPSALTACTTLNTKCRLSDGQPFPCLITGYNSTRVVMRGAPRWLRCWLRALFGAARLLLSARGAVGGGACRAPAPAPPSRTTRMDTSSTGPDMSWEQDVRVYNITMTGFMYRNTTHTHTHTETPHNHYTLIVFDPIAIARSLSKTLHKSSVQVLHREQAHAVSAFDLQSVFFISIQVMLEEKTLVFRRYIILYFFYFSTYFCVCVRNQCEVSIMTL